MYEVFHLVPEFPTIKGANSDPRKTKGAFEKSNGIASRGIKTWPPMQNNSKFSSRYILVYFRFNCHKRWGDYNWLFSIKNYVVKREIHKYFNE